MENYKLHEAFTIPAEAAVPLKIDDRIQRITSLHIKPEIERITSVLANAKKYDKANSVGKELKSVPTGGVKWTKLLRKLHKIERNNPGLGRAVMFRNLMKNDFF